MPSKKFQRTEKKTTKANDINIQFVFGKSDQVTPISVVDCMNTESIKTHSLKTVWHRKLQWTITLTDETDWNHVLIEISVSFLNFCRCALQKKTFEFKHRKGGSINYLSYEFWQKEMGTESVKSKIYKNQTHSSLSFLVGNLGDELPKFNTMIFSLIILWNRLNCNWKGIVIWACYRLNFNFSSIYLLWWEEVFGKSKQKLTDWG